MNSPDPGAAQWQAETPGSLSRYVCIVSFFVAGLNRNLSEETASEANWAATGGKSKIYFLRTFDRNHIL